MAVLALGAAGIAWWRRYRQPRHREVEGRATYRQRRLEEEEVDDGGEVTLYAKND